jgi:hypothetical protein
VENESTNRKIVRDNDSDAAIQALAQSRELQRTLIGLLRTGEITALYDGPDDPKSRIDVDHYKFYTPHPEEKKHAALSPEALQSSYGAYDDAMMAMSLDMLRDATERLSQAHANLRLPQYETDSADWSAISDEVRGVDDAFNHAFDIFADEVLPNLVALCSLASARRKELATLEAALGATSTAAAPTL